MLVGLVVATATFAVLAAAAELVLRSRAARARAAMKVESDSLCTVATDVPGLIYTYAPGRCGNNSRGYPDGEHSRHKLPGVFRIVLIGDSVAEGRAVARSERFAAVLQERLNALGRREVFEVVVMARVGYSTSQELIVLEKDAMVLEPDLILWSYCLKDPADPVFHNANGNLGAYYYRPSSYLLEWIRRAVFVARERWRGRHCPAEFHERVHCVYDGRVQGQLERIGATTRAGHVPVVFLIHPVFEEGKNLDDYSHAALHRRLAAIAADSGMAVLDLRPALAPYPADEIKIHSPKYFDPWHFNALGHRVTGEAIAAFLVEKGLIDGPPGDAR
jgi:lysophospholipase L1-like esterase